jgi:hypothetical protein
MLHLQTQNCAAVDGYPFGETPSQVESCTGFVSSVREDKKPLLISKLRLGYDTLPQLRVVLPLSEKLSIEL